ncbi:MAG: histidinol-phosphatase [Ruminococcus sp.]|nr:histidinol-phosphatase [Ruminococcus sp.]
MKANYHTHTFRCNHAWGEDREYVECAIEHGMKVLGFADHCPWVFDGGYVSATRMLPSQLDDYFSSLTALRDEYKGDITIYIGFEAEYIPELIEAQDRLLADYPVDYMIIGQHFLGNEKNHPLYTGFPTESEAELERYVELVIEGMESGRYKYVAHPDLMNYIGSNEVYEKHFSRLCSYLKQHDIPVEINLLGVRDRRHYTSGRFLEIAEKSGCSAIIGCDAHTPDALKKQEPIQSCVMLARNHGLPLVDYLPGLEPKQC